MQLISKIISSVTSVPHEKAGDNGPGFLNNANAYPIKNRRAACPQTDTFCRSRQG